jgi:basic membrane lipoprotein Med (substrate-binding protein (PBP1-ABC) superfamily)/DNA-binding SARP family transcriptional activator
VEYRILGPLEVTSDGRSIALGAGKQRAVLAVLVLHAGEIVSTDRLIELVWGEDPPRTAAHSVQIYVSELRKVLETPGQAPVIETRSPGYLLRADPETVDARRFEGLVAEARGRLGREDAAGAARSLHKALDLWRGPPLPDFTYDEFARSEIQHLSALHLDALELLAGAECELGRAQEALSLVERGIGEDPLRERFRELQMICLYRLGRHPEALRAFQGFQAILAEELGLDPSPSLRRLQERILLHDETLAAPGAGAAVTGVRNPYKGLRAFEEGDAEDFFGRAQLVEELVRVLASGARHVSVVGPSGCGKSSAMSAGLIPALRTGAIPGSERWDITKLVLGRRPSAQLQDALGGVRAGAPLLLVIDQLEQVFATGTEGPERDRFLERLSEVVAGPDADVRVVVCLRADFYDRPLLHPGFGEVFTATVVNVLPMTARQLEDAVVEPASKMGVTVEPALLAELVAEATGQPGALPLLEFSLTELFDRRSGAELGLEAYRSLGGLQGLVSRRSETLYEALDEEGMRTCLQVFLRLVQLGAGTKDARRRTRLRELTALGLDPVVLSEVLEGFGRHRLLTFDRDPATGEATVELAHEALLWEWERFAGWIEGHREDLRRLDSLVRVAEEWDGSGRDPDYLIAGSQLAGYEDWSRATPVRLAARERAFLDAALERRSAEELEEATQRESRRRLERRARSRLGELIAQLSEGRIAGPEVIRRTPDVALVWEGYGDGAFNEALGMGFDRAVDELGLFAHQRVISMESQDPLAPEMRRLSEMGVGLIVIGGAPGLGLDGGAPGLGLDGVEAVAREYADRRYVAIDMEGGLPNVTYLAMHQEEGSFLAGAAGALRCRTGTIGFIGGSRSPLIQQFEAGYSAGARAVRPDVVVRVAYLYPVEEIGGYLGFTDPRKASTVAEEMYGDGVDVIFTAAGSSGYGTLDAAARCSGDLGRHLWAIGVDVDMYEMLSLLRDLPDEIRQVWRAHILTSMVIRFDLVLSEILREHVMGTLDGGTREFRLADGATDISYSGGFLDKVRPVIEDLRARIVSREIVVPTRPEGP